MHINDLPSTTLVATAHRRVPLAAALSEAALGGDFLFFELIEGASRSGRLFSLTHILNTVPLDPRNTTSIGLATELLGPMKQQARYDPPVTLSRERIQGWKVLSAEIDGQPVAIVWAEWIDV